MALQYRRADELPAWQATATVNGVAPDFSTGHTFSVRLARDSTPTTTALTKTTNITGASGGVITVAWQADELDLPEGTYRAQLRFTQTTGTLEGTIEETIIIGSRLETP